MNNLTFNKLLNVLNLEHHLETLCTAGSLLDILKKKKSHYHCVTANPPPRLFAALNINQLSTGDQDFFVHLAEQVKHPGVSQLVSVTYTNIIESIKGKLEVHKKFYGMTA